MNIWLNGQKHFFSGTLLSELVESLNLAHKKFAIELNEEIIPRSLHDSTALRPEDKVEIVIAVGGG